MNEKLVSIEHEKGINPDSLVAAADDVTTTAPRKTDNKPPNRLRRVLLQTVLVLSILAAGVWYTVFEAQRIPSFYSAVLQTDTEQAKTDGQQFERKLVQLQNAGRRRVPWVIEITQDQVNGWFASDLAEKFSSALPKEVSEPRVVITQDEIRLAFKYTVAGITGVVVASADMFCTETPNEIALRLNRVRIGWLPLPVGPWLEKIADSIREVGIPVFWSESENSPVAVFTLPENVTQNRTRQVVVEAIDLQPGRLVIVGH